MKLFLLRNLAMMAMDNCLLELIVSSSTLSPSLWGFN